MIKLSRLTAFAVLAILAAVWQVAHARLIIVVGMVVSETGEPLNAINIYDVASNQPLGTTNLDGKFNVTCDEDAILRFESKINANEMEVEVNGRRELNVVFAQKSTMMKAVDVEGKYIPKPSPKPTKTQLVYRNGYLIVSNRITIPNKFFGSEQRLTVQPVLTNATTGVVRYMHPMLIDGWRYSDTQDRMLDFDMEHDDPCAPYVRVNAERKSEVGGKAFSVAYIDSIKVANPNDEYSCLMVSALEDYNRVYGMDTTIIPNGTVNPLRFFQYSMLARQIEDEKYLPSPELAQHADEGDISLSFELNKTTIDMNYGRNREVLDSLINVLHRIENDPVSASFIKSFSLTAKSSPEGNYATNLALSRARVKAATELITSYLSDFTRRNMEPARSDAAVERWDVLVDRMRAGGHLDEADKVQEIIDRYGDSHDLISAAVRRLPFYRPLITEEYLPGMRSLKYSIVAVQTRALNDDEILEKFAKDSTSLSEYEYFRLYRNIYKDDAQRERVMRIGHKYQPRSVVIANDYAAYLINHKRSDPSILEDVLAKAGPYTRIPHEVRFNQVAALLSVGRYPEAYGIAYRLPDDDPIYRKARNYASIFNNEFTDEIVAEECADSPMNEVVILLCLQEDEVALAKSKSLGDSADELYIKAICCYRIAKRDESLFDLWDDAEDYLYTALAKKPELKNTLLVDGDLVDFYKQCEARRKAYAAEEQALSSTEESDSTSESAED